MLLDREDAVQHRWRIDPRALQDGGESTQPPEQPVAFMDAHLFENGDLLGLLRGSGVVCLDWRSTVKWFKPLTRARAFAVGRDDTIHVVVSQPIDPDRRIRIWDDCSPAASEDFIDQFSRDGTLIRRVSLLDCLLRSRFALIVASLRFAVDPLGTCWIEEMDATHRDPALFEDATLLVTMAHGHLVAAIDPEREVATAVIAGPWKFPTAATLLPGSRLLVFDSRGHILASKQQDEFRSGRGISRAVEVDAVTLQENWQYVIPRGETPPSGGAVVGLSDGRASVVDVALREAHELDREGNVVSKWASPFSGTPESPVHLAVVYPISRDDLDVRLLERR